MFCSVDRGPIPSTAASPVILGSMMRNRIVQVSCAGLLFAAVAAFGRTTPLTHTSTSSLPAVGLASSETAQVNVVNTAPASPAGVASACTGSIAL